MRTLLVAAFVALLPSMASADPIPLPPPVPHCPDGSRGRLLWPSREGYCEPVTCEGTCARGTTCTVSCLCVGTVHGRPGPNVAEAELPNVVSACAQGSECTAPAVASLGSYCTRRVRRPSHHQPMLQKSAWLPLASLGPLALALGSIPALRRRRKSR